VSPCEHSKETSQSMKDTEFLDQLSASISINYLEVDKFRILLHQHFILYAVMKRMGNKWGAALCTTCFLVL
jgi:hypothetical protein